MSDFESFIQSLNESVELIESRLDLSSNTSGELKGGGGLIDTPSLLSRCESVCKKYDNKRPKIRIVHHLACSGGTLISKCISALPNVYLLSEVHPYTDLALGKSKPKFSPTDLVALGHYANIPNHSELAGKLFKQAVATTYKHVDNLGGILVLRDHTHSDYCTSVKPPKKSRVHELLEDDYEIESVLTIRDPIDSYTSLKKNGWIHFNPESFEEYCKRMLVMIKQFKTDQIYSYEDFVADPQDVLKKIALRLNLPFDDSFEEIFGGFRVTGDSGRSSDRIEERARRTDTDDLKITADQKRIYEKIKKRVKRL